MDTPRPDDSLLGRKRCYRIRHVLPLAVSFRIIVAASGEFEQFNRQTSENRLQKCWLIYRIPRFQIQSSERRVGWRLCAVYRNVGYYTEYLGFNSNLQKG